MPTPQGQWWDAHSGWAMALGTHAQCPNGAADQGAPHARGRAGRMRGRDGGLMEVRKTTGRTLDGPGRLRQGGLGLQGLSSVHV